MDDKKALRAKYSALRNSFLQKKEVYSENICRNCSSLLEFSKAETVLLYYSKGSEADLWGLAALAFEMGKSVGYPRCNPDGTITFHKIFSRNDLNVGSYGIREPESTAPLCSLENAVCFVPGLCFDKAGYRLGYGKGYYDRFLSGFCGTAVGVTYDICLADKLPKEAHDKKTDYIITESQVKRTIES